MEELKQQQVTSSNHMDTDIEPQYDPALKDLQKQLANQDNFKNLVESDINIDAAQVKQGAPSQEKLQQQQVLQQVEILGAVKVRDGLFLGDEYSSQDLEFVIANKVTHIINCAGRQIFNQWTPVGVKYLTFYWLDDDRQLIFDDHDQVAKEIFDFIEEANEECNGVLVHSVRGQSRACCVLSIYLMMKFRWTLLKGLEFINSRRPNLEIRASFLQQLSQWERRTRENYPKRTDRWEDLMFDHHEHLQTGPGKEELLLRNTFMNAQMQPVNYLQQWKEDMLNSIQQSARARKLKWGDNGDDAQKKHLIRENSDFDLINKEEHQIEIVDNHKKEFKGKPVLKKKQDDIKEDSKDSGIAIKLPKESSDSNLKSNESVPKDTLKDSSKGSQQNNISDVKNLINETPIQQKQPESIQQEKIEQRQKVPKKRPVTPLIVKSQSTDLVSATPRSLDKTDDKSLSSQNLQLQKQLSNPKRSQSNKRTEQKEKEERDKRDKYKAKVAWNAASPKDKNMILLNGNNTLREGDLKKLTAQSPAKNSSILKKELLEKAKKALAERSQVNIGLDIKKIQETLNKISDSKTQSSQIVGSSGLQQKTQGNIINNNNINNFFIQNASLIELPKEEQKTQSAIGNHHHKRTGSGSIQIAQQIKQNLQQLQSSIPATNHRKNQLSEHVQSTQPIIFQGNTQEILKGMSSRTGNLASRKDFKQIIKDLQRESLSAMASSQQFWMNQAKKYQIKNHPQNSDILQVSKKQLQNTAVIGGVRSSSRDSLTRPGSAQQNYLLQTNVQKLNSINKSRKLRKQTDSTDKLSIATKKHHRRAQTPMPQSPTNNIVLQSELQHKAINKLMSVTNGLSVQNMSLNTSNNQGQNSFTHQNSSKRSKSPSIGHHKLKLQAKQNQMLIQSTQSIPSKQSLKAKNWNYPQQSVY